MSGKWKAIIPAPFKLAAFKTAITVRMDGTAKDIKADFDKTTATWSHTVKFDVTISGVFKTNVKVATSDKIYIYVNDGTPAHIISGRLKIPSSFAPKTKPGVIGSTAGAKGSPVYARHAAHPGAEARKFDEAIAKKWEKKLGESLELALRDGAIASGHVWGVLR